MLPAPQFAVSNKSETITYVDNVIFLYYFLSSMGARSFEELLVWQKAHAYVLDIYRMTENYPRSELFGLISQMRRAAVSVPANIAEGFKKRAQRIKFVS